MFLALSTPMLRQPPQKKSATAKAALNSTKGGRWRRQRAITQAERSRKPIIAAQQRKGKSFLCVAALTSLIFQRGECFHIYI
jgi:hypothetical protein